MDTADFDSEMPATQFSAGSDDNNVAATVSASFDVLRVHVSQSATPPEAEAGIVQAVNRALDKAQNQHPDDLVKARDARVEQFNQLVDTLESEVARTRARFRP